MISHPTRDGLGRRDRGPRARLRQASWLVETLREAGAERLLYHQRLSEQERRAFEG